MVSLWAARPVERRPDRAATVCRMPVKSGTMPQTENLTIMFTDMVGFTERTSRQSRDQNKRMLQQQDHLLLPVVARFGGRHIKSIGDAYLIAFRSPTDAVRCGMALHDALAEFNATHADSEQMHIRVAINVGEVRLEAKDIFGEPVNVAARVESITPPDEIYFTEAVYLAMNKAEVPCEALGSEKLKGIPEPIKLFRVPAHQINRLVPGGENLEAAPGELPYGGMHRQPAGKHAAAVVVETLRLAPSRIGVSIARWRLENNHLWVGAVALLVLVCVLGGLWALRSWHSTHGAPSLAGQSAAALQTLQQGHAAYAQGRRLEALRNYEKALQQSPQLQNDPLLAINLVAGLSGVSDLAIPLIRSYPSPQVVQELVRRTTQPGMLGRRRASDLLTELGHADQIDRTLLAIADLQESQKCEDKLLAIKRLRKLKDARALPALEKSRGSGISDWWKNRCLRDEADAAIQELKRRQPQAPRKS